MMNNELERMNNGSILNLHLAKNTDNMLVQSTTPTTITVNIRMALSMPLKIIVEIIKGTIHKSMVISAQCA